jgi:alpha-L-fucosidase
MNALALNLQPDIIVNNRNWLPGDFAVAEQHTDGDDRDWESCMTLNDAWFYVPGDRNWKSAQQVVKSLVLCCRDGGNYLLNIGPRGDGSIPEHNVEVFRRLGSWMAANGSAIYGTQRTRLRYSKIAGYTRKDNTAFMHVHFWPGTEIVIAGVAAKLKAAWFTATRAPIRFEQHGTKITLKGLPAEAPDEVATVIALEFASEPIQDCLASRTAKRMYALADEIGFKW